MTAKWNMYEVNSITRKELFGKNWDFVSNDWLSSWLEEFTINLSNASTEEINIAHSNLEVLEKLIEEPEITLASRTKRHRMSFGEKMLLYKKMIATNNAEGWARRFGTSKSSIYRMRKEFN